jgi:hypothetical protein
MAEARVQWAQGGEASVVSVLGETIALRSTTSSPPGSRIDGTLAEEPPAALRLKVHSCRRQAGGAFLLEGRLLNLTRELRERLAPREGGKVEA